MDQIKLAGELSNENTNDVTSPASDEVRTLRDLEMVLVGGGADPIPTW